MGIYVKFSRCYIRVAFDPNIILYDYQDLDLQTVFLLDRMQKGLPVEKEDVDRLRIS